MFQSEWQGIPFASFIRPSPNRLAGPDFYQAFYEEFFSRYQAWDELPKGWHEGKQRWAEFVLARAGGGRMLSVGCGLGAMEHFMLACIPQPDLCIHEVAPSAWQWIGAELGDDRKFIGMIPGCMPESARFNLVYLSAVDYALPDDALIGLLQAIRPLLTERSGQCLLLSASFQDVPVNVAGRTLSLARDVKSLMRYVCESVGICPRRQLWGWTRTREEYRSIMRRAGYSAVQDGFMDAEHRLDYWISGV